MLLLAPYRVNVLYPRWPVANWALIAACVATYALTMSVGFPEALLMRMVLYGWHPYGLVGHLFVHAGVLHIFGNMLFLWVFGNAICARVGNLFYPLLFVFLGVVAAAVHNLASGAPAVGASGAINGIIGFYVVVHPVDEVSCFYLVGWRAGILTLSGVWPILLWTILDLVGALIGAGGVAYWAHLGGFAAGLGVGLVALKLGWVARCEQDNETLPELLSQARIKRYRPPKRSDE